MSDTSQNFAIGWLSCYPVLHEYRVETNSVDPVLKLFRQPTSTKKINRSIERLMLTRRNSKILRSCMLIGFFLTITTFRLMGIMLYGTLEIVTREGQQGIPGIKVGISCDGNSEAYFDFTGDGGAFQLLVPADCTGYLYVEIPSDIDVPQSIRDSRIPIDRPAVEERLKIIGGKGGFLRLVLELDQDGLHVINFGTISAAH